MTRLLDDIFAELGLSRYLDAFVDQGFDTWDTILDIQESDLDALGVKLGHRRKLQRRIANARGIAPSVSLASVKSTTDEVKPESSRRESSRLDGNSEGSGVTKRKYRRHPKPDENAPERPPSAYVLFSNKMREDLKGQSLTFTEIAKLVGENWQSLDPTEKETYESQANAAKEKYHRDLAEYKKTPEYRRYSHYLHDFKEKQAKHMKVGTPEVTPRQHE
ncbi:High mobility group, superfamily [Purpureocillium lavendulum]|uniref:High mobility group, superfamily n=1 Tax=Purpureocillium lavendulum TaxID=1247861 RepID=A0AB34G459_9HYPO|nr:High mobility group, superfamily [Purpureocillium lavendulum]